MYGLGRLGSLRNIVLLRKPNTDDDEQPDGEFLEIILQGLSNRHSQFDRIILLDADATCSFGR